MRQKQFEGGSINAIHGVVHQSLTGAMQFETPRQRLKSSRWLLCSSYAPLPRLICLPVYILRAFNFSYSISWYVSILAPLCKVFWFSILVCPSLHVSAVCLYASGSFLSIPGMFLVLVCMLLAAAGMFFPLYPSHAVSSTFCSQNVSCSSLDLRVNLFSLGHTTNTPPQQYGSTTTKKQPQHHHYQKQH